MFSLQDIHTRPLPGEERLGELLDQSVEIDPVRHGIPPKAAAAGGARALTPRHTTVIVPSSQAREMMNANRNDAAEHHFRAVNPASIELFKSIIFHECSQVTPVGNSEEKNMNPYLSTADIARERDAHAARQPDARDTP